MPGPRVPTVSSNFVVFCDRAVMPAVLGSEAADRPNEQIEWSGRTNQVNPHDSWRFVAKSLSRVARPARGAVRTRCVLVQYGEGPRGESAGRMTVVAADQRLQQKHS